MTQRICRSCQALGAAEEANRSEECTRQVASRPCANGFHGKWVKNCKLRHDNNENQREPRQHQDEVCSVHIFSKKVFKRYKFEFGIQLATTYLVNENINRFFKK